MKMCEILEAFPNSITKVIPFLNDDVPKYLEKLRKFEEESRKVVIEVR